MINWFLHLIGWRKRKLVCMRLEEMWNRHANQITRHCSVCGGEVGVFPSGQGILLKYGEHRISLICNHCHSQTTEMEPAPGAIDEMLSFVPKPKD